MNFCQDHWTRLREKIEERGLGHLIARDGETAAAQMADQLKRNEEDPTPVNFEPLLGAWGAIGSNVAQAIGPGALYVLVGGMDAPQDLIEFKRYPNGVAVQNRLALAGLPPTWPRCGLCYLGLAHELTCTEPRCTLPKVDGYAFYLDRAADDARSKAEELGLVKT